MTPDSNPPLTRRLLLGAGVAGLSSLLATRPRSQKLWIPPTNFTSGPACTLTPSATEGPYYVNPALLRQDITEGRSGFPLLLNFTVIKASTCAPIQNAVVDVWHCDTAGVYSGFAGQLGGLDTIGDNFYRGIQTTDANGVATFRTNYPGYYPGRTVHIHFKVWQNGTQSVTSQCYFDDLTTDEVFAAIEPYNGRATRTTRNANDGIFTAATVMTTTAHAGGIAAALTLVVN